MVVIHFAGPLVRRGAYYCVMLPQDATVDLHSRSRVKVRGTINGRDYEGFAFPSGDGGHLILINAGMRQALDLKEGEEVVVILESLSAESQGEDE